MSRPRRHGKSWRCWGFVCLDVARFVPLPEFHTQVAGLFDFVKTAPLAQRSKEILIPGEPEARLEAERRLDGVPVEDETWNQIERVAAELGSARGTA